MMMFDGDVLLVSVEDVPIYDRYDIGVANAKLWHMLIMRPTVIMRLQFKVASPCMRRVDQF